MSNSESWGLAIDCVDRIFEYLHNIQSEVNYAGQYNKGMFLGGGA